MKIAVIGGFGRMGKRIIELALADGKFTIACAVEYKGAPVIGRKIGECFPSAQGDGHGVFSETLEGDIDVVIDFSTPESTLRHLNDAVKKKIAYVIGTTGFSEAEEKTIAKASSSIPVVKSPNMSLGVNLLFKVTKDVASILGKRGYDMEIVELHHNKKKDSPSGTARKLLDLAAEGAGLDASGAVYGREGLVGERKSGEIGVMAVRAGDIVGEHTVYFVGNNERIELTHRAHTRDALARGAIEAAKFVHRKKPGLYDMQDVLGLK
jgi:4-hydroxy-tetrahydrodipicolinate reductase